MKSKNIQFGLGALLLYMIFSAVALGASKSLGLGGRFAAFCIVFMGLMLFVLALMLLVKDHRLVVVHAARSEESAIICRDFLRNNGIGAIIKRQGLIGFGAMPTQGMVEVLVEPDMESKARELLNEHAGE